MRHFSLFFGVLMMGLLSFARPAAADIPPLGACGVGEVGEPCDEAVDESGHEVGSGICVAEQCKRATPDGPMTYDCAMCRPKPAEPSAGGAANDPVQPTAGAGAGEAPVKPSAGASNDPGEPSAGSAGSPSTGKGGASASSAGATNKPTEKPEAEDAGGCSMSSAGRGAGSAALASLVVLGLALARRRFQIDG